MRIGKTALNLARIAGWGAGLRYLHAASRITLAAFLDELSALCLLWRSRLLTKRL